jgi:hypothetical protein
MASRPLSRDVDLSRASRPAEMHGAPAFRGKVTTEVEGPGLEAHFIPGRGELSASKGYADSSYVEHSPGRLHEETERLLAGRTKDRVVSGGAGFGADIVGDFTERVDKLQFAAVPGIADLAIADDGFGNAVIMAGTQGSVLLLGVTASSLGAADMVFT